MMFYYAARGADGSSVRGSIEADSRDAAARHLKARSLFITTLETMTTARGAMAAFDLNLRRKTTARPVFFRSFATLIGAGIPVRRSLETMIAQSGHGSFTEALRSIAADVEGGSALSAAMERHPDDFREVAVAMVRAGEIGGSLDDALLSVAELEERDQALRKRVGAALAYPCIVSLAAFALVTFLLANTMPAFATMFAELHVSLPLSTRVLIGLGSAMQGPFWWLALAAAGVAGWILGRRARRSDAAWAATLDRLRLRLPWLGPILVKSTLARFSRTLGSLLRAGVDVVAALEASAAVLDGFVYRRGLERVVDALRRGETLGSPFASSGLFDATFLQLLHAGEESGAVDVMLLRLATAYELDVEMTLAALTSVIEPLLICVLGAAIGTIVASILIPLYSMIGAIK